MFDKKKIGLNSGGAKFGSDAAEKTLGGSHLPAGLKFGSFDQKASIINLNKGDLNIEGKDTIISATITDGGHVQIKDGGHLIGDLTAKELTLHSGAWLEGNVSVDRLTVYNNASLKGNVMAMALSVEKGANLIGKFEIKEKMANYSHKKL